MISCLAFALLASVVLTLPSLNRMIFVQSLNFNRSYFNQPCANISRAPNKSLTSYNRFLRRPFDGFNHSVFFPTLNKSNIAQYHTLSFHSYIPEAKLSPINTTLFGKYTYPTTNYDETRFSWFYILSKAKECNLKLAIDVEDIKNRPGVKVIAYPWDKGKLSQQWRWVERNMLKNRLNGLHMRVRGRADENIILAHGNPEDTYQRFYMLPNDCHIHFRRDNGQIQVMDIKLANRKQNFTVRNDIVLHNPKTAYYNDNQKFVFIRAY